MKSIILHDHEVRQLDKTGKVLVVRAIEPVVYCPLSRVEQIGDTENWKVLPRYLNDHDTTNSNRVCPFSSIGTRFFVKRDLSVVETEAVVVGRVQEIRLFDAVDAGMISQRTQGSNDICALWDQYNPRNPWDANPFCWFATMRKV